MGVPGLHIVINYMCKMLLLNDVSISQYITFTSIYVHKSLQKKMFPFARCYKSRVPPHVQPLQHYMSKI